MSRIAATFANLKTLGRKALIPYVTAGFPFADVTPELMHAMVAGGADVIELGVPFSDPSADGPVIQKAGEKALSFGIGHLADGLGCRCVANAKPHADWHAHMLANAWQHGFHGIYIQRAGTGDALK